MKRGLLVFAAGFTAIVSLRAQEYVSTTVPEVHYTDSVKPSNSVDIRRIYVGPIGGYNDVILGLAANAGWFKIFPFRNCRYQRMGASGSRPTSGTTINSRTACIIRPVCAVQTACMRRRYCLKRFPALKTPYPLN